MLTAITTRKSTQHEDAEPWPGGSARPALAYLTSTAGLTGDEAADLLTAARTAQAEGGPGTLADYPIPGRNAHLLIHYAPGSRAYRLKLTAPEGNEGPPETTPEPGTVPGNHPDPDRPSDGRETQGATAPPGPAKITVSLWHNIATDAHDRPAGMLDGYQPGHPMVRVFTYQADPAGQSPEAIAEQAFAIGNGHPADTAGQELSRRYYQRQLRSLSVGDVVTIGEAPLAVARAGWTRLRGALTEARAHQHGTHPLPEPS
ncbi:MAG TPA: hypothetical protein VGI96_01275 [Streptosporangiaceae bacterium]|jgi:hypothetical protein